MPKITFLLENNQDIVAPVDGLITVGRREGNSIVVDDERISARHAEIAPTKKGGFEVRDLGSKTGTFVNNQRVKKRHDLRDGDKLAFGPLVGVFTLQDAPLPEPAAVLTKRNTSQGTEGRKRESARLAETKPKNTKALALPAIPVSPHTEKITAGPKKPAGGRLELPAANTAALEAEIKLLLTRRDDVQAELRNEERSLEEKRAASRAALDAELAALRGEVAQLQMQRDGATQTLALDQKKLKSTRSDLLGQEARLTAINAELEAREKRVALLHADEERLIEFTAGLQNAETKHGEWVAAVAKLSQEYYAKSADVARVTAESELATQELDTMASHKREALSLLEHLHNERDAAIVERNDLANQVTELQQRVQANENRNKEAQELADAREDQVRSIERKIEQLDHTRTTHERNIAELAGVEKRLKQALADAQAGEARHSELTGIVSALAAQQLQHETHLQRLSTLIAERTQEQAGLESRIQQIKSEFSAEERAFDEFLAKTESTRHRLNTEIAALEGELSKQQAAVAAETQTLADLMARRSEIEGQVRQLAHVEKDLTEARVALQKTEELCAGTQLKLEGLNENYAVLQASLDSLGGEEDAAKGRIEVLRGRENDLREALVNLTKREAEQRSRFEEIQKLTADAETNAAEQTEQLTRGLDLTRRELADMEMKLAPLRDWKDAMDKRYERLAALPEDSAEARELWREIEAEKAGLRNLITVKAGDGTRGITLSEAVLRGMTEPIDDAPSNSRTTRPTASRQGTLHAPPDLNEGSDDPILRGNVGNAGTGALISGTGQEMALKARLNRLRESVQREATRLEFLRQERAREESRGRTGAPVKETMIREQGRQVESKVRREEELLATLQRKVEMAEVEEEKRRERVADMERKLAELKADIAQAERVRGDARHQADIAQAEVKALDEAVERRRKILGEL